MRKLSASELRLSAALGAALLIALLAFVGKWYLTRVAALKADIVQLEATRSEYVQLIEEKPFWVQRGEWMAAHPAEVYEGTASDSRFAEEIQRTVTGSGLIIESQDLHEAVRQGSLAKSVIELTARGSLEQLVRWLHAVQQPGRYVAVEALNLKKAGGDKEMSMRVRLAKIQRESRS